MSDELSSKNEKGCCGEAHVHSMHDPDCLKIFAQLSDYVDGELSESDCETIRRHICDCEPCIEFVESLRQSIRAARELGVEEKPVALPADARERLRAIWAESMRRREAAR